MIPDGRSLDVKIAHLEDMVAGASTDLSAVRESLTTAVDQFNRRLAMVEMNVRALEDWRLAQKVLDTERAQVRRLELEHQAELQRRQVTRVDLLVAVLAIVLTCAATITASLIASHAI